MLFSPEEKAQGLVEYGLVIVLIAVLLVGVIALVGTSLSTIFSRIASAIPT